MDKIVEQLADIRARITWFGSLVETKIVTVKKKRDPTGWTSFRKRVAALVKETQTFPSFGQLSMFCSYLRDEKPYDEWEDTNILNRYYEYITYEETDEQKASRKMNRRDTLKALRAAELRKPLSEINTTILLEDSDSEPEN
jgi:hypothetical protein